MKQVKIYGAGCAKCKQTDAAVRRVIAELQVEAQVEKVEEIQAIVRAGVLRTPALSVDGEMKVSGRVPREEEIKAWLM